MAFDDMGPAATGDALSTTPLRRWRSGLLGGAGRSAQTWCSASGWLAGLCLVHGLSALPRPHDAWVAVGGGLLGLLVVVAVRSARWRTWADASREGGRRATLAEGDHAPAVEAARGLLADLLVVCSVLVSSVGVNSLMALAALESRIDPPASAARWHFDAVVERMPLVNERSTRVFVRVVACEVADRAAGCRPGLGLRLNWYGAPYLAPGQSWTLVARVRAPHAPTNPDLFDAELRALEDGVDGVGSIRSGERLSGESEARARSGLAAGSRVRIEVESLRQGLRDRINSVLTGEAAEVRGVILGLALGDQAAISSTWWERFNRLGVGHLFSISGSHVTAFAAVAGFLLAYLWRARTWVRMLVRSTGRVPAAWINRPRLIALCACMAAFAYAALAGWGIPAQRTCWMLATGAGALLGARSRRMGVVLLLAALAVTLSDPWSVLSAGFCLSFGAVVIIVLATRRQLADPGRQGGWRAAWRAQWAVSLLMLPLGATFFATGAWIAPIVNLLAIPLVTALLTPLSLLGMACVGLPWVGKLLGSAVLAVTAYLVRLSLDGARWLDALAGGTWVLGRPSALVVGVAICAVLGLIAPWPVKRRGLLLLACLPVFMAPPLRPEADALWVQVIDVGQGMAVLVEAPGMRLLYDAGPAYDGDGGQGEDSADAGRQFILPWLRSRGIERLDALVISHGDNDHVGGALSLLKSLQIDSVHSSLGADHPVVLAAGARHRPCLAGPAGLTLPTAADGLHLAWLQSRDGGAASIGRRTRNAGSCVLRISSAAGTILLPGDISAREEAALIARHGPEALRADLLIAPHHGSAGSSSEAFVAAVRPAAVVFQVGYRNRYGHPRPAVVERYRRHCSRRLRTDHDGAIGLRLVAGRLEAPVRARSDGAPYWRVRPDSEGGDARDESCPGPAAKMTAPPQ